MILSGGSVFSNSYDLANKSDIIFVSDMFVDDYVGGAELTTETLIDILQENNLKVYKIHSKDITKEFIENLSSKYWIFGNFSSINLSLLPQVISTVRYSVLEYDYKYCKARSPEKHKDVSKKDCDCHKTDFGMMINVFYQSADTIFWMSEEQRNHYFNLFQDMKKCNNSFVLSSVFSKSTIQFLSELRNTIQKTNKWVVLGSNSWVKGFEQSKKWCILNQKDYEVVWNLPYQSLLKKLATSEGFVYLPSGKDTCPRMVIEAKLLNCKLELNEYIQNKNESWFTKSVEEVESYLLNQHKNFVNMIKYHMNNQPKISGYLTTYNCESQEYPFVQCIKSLLGFCDEICIVDGGSTDKTFEILVDLAYPDIEEKFSIEEKQRFIEDLKNNEYSLLQEKLNKSKFIIRQIKRNWSDKNFAVYDGMQKAEARKLCTSEFCWQIDSDEIVHENDYNKIKHLCRKFPKNAELIALPVIEYWGSYKKVRVDINPWKWRLSRNNQNITHGIPLELRQYDENGLVSAKHGTDGCDFIYESTGLRVPFVTFYNQQVDNVRILAMNDNEQLQIYSNWFNNIVDQLPSVFHYSWFNIERKIRLYKKYWSAHWVSMYGKEVLDTQENNMFFDCSWKDVTDEMIKNKAIQLSNSTGGWIWHRKWNGQRINSMTCRKNPPKIMESWI